MKLTVSPDLSFLTVAAEGFEQKGVLGNSHISSEAITAAVFENPVLLTDFNQIYSLSPPVRDAVFALYQSYPRTVSYDGTEVSWSPHVYPEVWCPSIDTVFFAKYLKESLKGVNSIAEIGCGSGFLSKFALEHSDSLQRAVASDISIPAIQCTADNIARSPFSPKLSLLRPHEDAKTLGLAGKFNLIITNPPYIPRPEENHNNPYEGLGLVHKLSREASSLLEEGGQILINLSSLASDTPLEWFAEEGFRATLLGTMRVPLKVNPVTSGLSPESVAWISYLKNKQGLEVTGEDGYMYWHQLRMFMLQRNRDV